MNYWIWLATIEGLGPIQKKKLLEKYETPKKIYNTKLEELEKDEFLREGMAKKIFENKDISLLRRYEEYIEKHDIKVINIFDKEYPNSLKNIYDPPITIFAKGDISLLNYSDSIAIVGCRNATKYGLNVAKEIAYDLAKENILIVSGMAKGIDGSAHKGALEANGKTIAVLGSGVDVPYPAQNIDLYKEIMQKGLIISEYIVGTKPEASNFPARNRIVSGLSKGVLVVEASLNSGSMITVDFGLEQGKNIYAIPGNINMPNSNGTNELIKSGAQLITSYEDIISDLHLPIFRI